MLIHDVEQGSEAWMALRRGLPTSSNFKRILSVKTGKPLAGAETYMNELIAESIIGESIGPDATGFMARGLDMEAEARSYYEFKRDVDVRQVGFVTSDDGGVGCSPDGLVGEDGELEIKCPAAHIFVGLATGGDHDAYFAQIQGSLWITGRQWCDLFIYSPHPQMPKLTLRYKRDEKFIHTLAMAVGEFNARLRAKRARLLAMGAVPAGAA